MAHKVLSALLETVAILPPMPIVPNALSFEPLYSFLLQITFSLKNVTQLLYMLSSIRLEKMYNGMKSIAMNESLVNNNSGNKNNIITNYDNYYYLAP